MFPCSRSTWLLSRFFTPSFYSQKKNREKKKVLLLMFFIGFHHQLSHSISKPLGRDDQPSLQMPLMPLWWLIQQSIQGYPRSIQKGKCLDFKDAIRRVNNQFKQSSVLSKSNQLAIRAKCHYDSWPINVFLANSIMIYRDSATYQHQRQWLIKTGNDSARQTIVQRLWLIVRIYAMSLSRQLMRTIIQE